MSALEEAKENFLFIARRGWFLPGPESFTGLFPRSEKGGSLGYREAAVLCLLCYHRDRIHILLTKRSRGISFEGMLYIGLPCHQTAVREVSRQVSVRTQSE